MLWIAIRLPRFPLEVFLRGVSAATCSTEATSTPWIVADTHTVLVTNDAALAHGVRPGMSLSAAYALARALRVQKRDPAREVQSLRSIATWAGQFTPNVSLEGDSGLLLEISGSLKLFGGIAPIAQRLRTGITALGFTASIAAAPTARAAWWLACGGKETIVQERTALPAKLAALSIDTLDWAGCDATTRLNTITTLNAIGVNTLGEVMALPRDGFARRFGQRLLDAIDQALGRTPEARRFFIPPEQFHTRLELPAAVDEASALLFATKRLLVELCGFLAARASGVQQFHLTFEHDDRPATLLAFNLVAPGRDESHLALLVRERLNQLKLPAPVYDIALAADTLVPLTGANLTLFRDKNDGSADWSKLVERLRARLGTTAVHGLAVVAEHRPEYVVRTVTQLSASPARASTSASIAVDAPDRPFWLLATPQPLIEVDAKPFLRGPLALVAGPERIESGWWDGGDVQRDYFVAQDADRTLLWVYRDSRNAGGWFLHGLFA